MTSGGAGRPPRRPGTGAPSDLPERLRDAAPRDLVSVEPSEDGSLPTWPQGPFIDLAPYPETLAHLRQVANLASDAARFREGRGWTRDRVAEQAGLNKDTYGDFEAGRTWPLASTLYRIADALEADLRLVGRRPPASGPQQR